VDTAAREVRIAGTPSSSRPRSTRWSSSLRKNPRRVLKRQQLENSIYTLDDGALSNVVEVYVSRLRRKLGRDAIRTVRGFGYQWGAAGHAEPETNP